jgi:ankyrin repeat protein
MGRMKAAEQGNSSIAKMLIDGGTDLSIHNNDGCCALVRACNYGHIDITRHIVEAGGDINIKSRSGNTGLMKVISF